MNNHQKAALRRHWYPMPLEFRADGVYRKGEPLRWMTNPEARKLANQLIVSAKHRDDLLALLGDA